MRNKTICIDLTEFSQKKLRVISEKYQISYDFLIHNKNVGCAKIWIDLDMSMMVGFTTKKSDRFELTEQWTDTITNIKPIKFKNNDKSLSVDSILDKISKFGIKSLTKIEKQFLDNQ